MAKRRANNEGSFTELKDGRWQGRVTIGYNDDGKPIRKAFYGRSQEDVKQKLIDKMYKKQTGTYIEPTQLKVKDWLDTWLNDYMKPSLRPTTWANYETQIIRHLKPAIGNLKLIKLQTSDLQRLYNAKSAAGLAPKSVKNIHSVIHAALEQAKKEGKILINPADAVKLPRPKEQEMKTLDSKGLEKFLKEAVKSKHYVAYLVAISTGLRRGELLALRWKDVDLDHGSITIRQSLTRIKNDGLVFQEPKTPLSFRTISIPEGILEELKSYKSRQSEHKLQLMKAYDQELDLVFCSGLSKPLDPSDFTRAFQKVLDDAKMPKMRFHDLRHTFATLSLQEGISAKAVQEALGHHSAPFTMTVYSHVTDQMKKEHTEKIGALLSSCISSK